MDSYFIKSASSDIAFCHCLCANLKCDRNMNGKLFHSVMANNEFYSCCDFSMKCKDYVSVPRVCFCKFCDWYHPFGDIGVCEIKSLPVGKGETCGMWKAKR